MRAFFQAWIFFFFDYAQANTPVQLLLMGWKDNLAVERKGFVFLHLGVSVEDSHAITSETGQRLLQIVGSKGWGFVVLLSFMTLIHDLYWGDLDGRPNFKMVSIASPPEHA